MFRKKTASNTDLQKSVFMFAECILNVRRSIFIFLKKVEEEKKILNKKIITKYEINKVAFEMS